MSDEGFAWECSKCGTVNGIHRDSCDTCGNNIYKSQAAEQATPPAERPTPITDADERNYPQPEYLQLIQFEGCTMGVIDPDGYAELYDKSRDLERQLAEAREENARLNKALSNASAIYDAAREQRDRLADALEKIASGAHDWKTCVDKIAPEALAATKGDKQ